MVRPIPETDSASSIDTSHLLAVFTPGSDDIASQSISDILGSITGAQLVAILSALSGNSRLPATAIRDLPAAAPFDLHDDVTTQIPSVSAADRFVVSDESSLGDPNRYVRADTLRAYMQAGLSFSDLAGDIAAGQIGNGTITLAMLAQAVRDMIGGGNTEIGSANVAVPGTTSVATTITLLPADVENSDVFSVSIGRPVSGASWSGSDAFDGRSWKAMTDCSAGQSPNIASDDDRYLPLTVTVQNGGGRNDVRFWLGRTSAGLVHLALQNAAFDPTPLTIIRIGR